MMIIGSKKHSYDTVYINTHIRTFNSVMLKLSFSSQLI